MFKHLLVPLDGSTLAEAALPAVAFLSRKLSIPLTLVHVIEQDAPQEIHGERHLTSEEEALAYLEEVASRSLFDGLEVNQHVHTAEVNDVARSIVEHAGEYDSDLIVMCTHGRSGVRSWLFGSIAQQIINFCKTPVLLIQPTKRGKAPEFNCQRLLVGLDGNPDHEQALPIAAELAHACLAEFYLAMVIHTYQTLPIEQAVTARLLPGSTAALLELTEESAAQYLQRQITPFREAGLSVIAQVRRGDPAKMIVQIAKKVNAGLIVLGTHGKTAGESFWSGSITPQIMRYTRLPLLLVPVRKE
jgi:nucleotide-binding universal stress UspA family protein